MPLALSPLPHVGQVAGEATRHDEQCVDADIVAFPRIARRQPLGGDRYAAKPIFIQGPGGGFVRAALLDFDKGDDASAPGDQVDFSARDPGATCKDAPAS